MYLFNISQTSTALNIENIFNTINLPIESLYIINDSFHGTPNYSKLPNLKFLYIEKCDIRSSFNFNFLENLETLYLNNTSFYLRDGEISDFSQLRSIKTLYIHTDGDSGYGFPL